MFWAGRGGKYLKKAAGAFLEMISPTVAKELAAVAGKPQTIKSVEEFLSAGREAAKGILREGGTTGFLRATESYLRNMGVSIREVSTPKTLAGKISTKLRFTEEGLRATIEASPENVQIFKKALTTGQIAPEHFTKVSAFVHEATEVHSAFKMFFRTDEALQAYYMATPALRKSIFK
ncbi:MAG: hypothetical protein DRN26_01055, partial [Thermoplasmata archaeon]